MKLSVVWILIIVSFLPIISSQIYPGFYEVSSNVISESGSSETGHCSNMADSGRVCNSPRSSVLFDNISTLTELDGDMWARQLLTFNTSTSPASITFNFTTTSDRNGPTTYTGVQTIEVVMFNCPSRGIGTNSIIVSNNFATIKTTTLNTNLMNCSYLVRICVDLTTSSTIVTLTFQKIYQRIYVAEVKLYSNPNRCFMAGPIISSILTTTLSDAEGETTNIMGDTTTSTEHLPTNSTFVSTLTSTILSLPPDFRTNSTFVSTLTSTILSLPPDSSTSGTMTIVIAVVVVIILLVVIIAVFVMVVGMTIKKRKQYSSLTFSIATDPIPQKNVCTYQVEQKCTELEILDEKKEKLLNKALSNEKVDQEENLTSAPVFDCTYEKVSETCLTNVKYDKVDTNADHQVYNTLNHNVGEHEGFQHKVNPLEGTYSTLESSSCSFHGNNSSQRISSDVYAVVNKPQKSVRPNTQANTTVTNNTYAHIQNSTSASMLGNSQDKVTNDSKESTPPVIPGKSQDLEIYLETKQAMSKLIDDQKKEHQIDDIYAVPDDTNNTSRLTSGVIATTSYNNNPLYNSVDYDLEADNVYSEPSIQDSKISESTLAENIYESIYSESLQPSLFSQQRSTELEESPNIDDLCPYSSIYTAPVVPSELEKPLKVTVNNIHEDRQLGSGQFGKVILAHTVGLSLADLKMGTSSDKGISILVAVKVLKSSATATTVRQFEKEYRFMFRLNHPNVIRMLGICTEGTLFIMMEYMEKGDLNQVLRHQYSTIIDDSCMPGDGEITRKTLIHICTQIAGGMNYLASNNFIHRDIATRNCLMGEDFSVKIADFGMSRSLYESQYYIIKGHAILPIRWMASECFYGKFSAKTDVWAFGCTMWEVFELCKHEPYYKMTDQQMVEDAVLGAERTVLSQPEGCPDSIHKVMKLCWAHEACDRATFKELFTLLLSLNN